VVGNHADDRPKIHLSKLSRFAEPPLYREKDIAFSPFAGMLPEAVWLTPETIKHIGEANGFGVVEQQVLQERNGLRGRFYLKRLKE